MTDVYASLLPLAWKKMVVPSTRLTFRFAQDAARHEYPGRDGAKLEGTGRAPLQFTAVIPFRNGIEAGPHEKWSTTPLYPNAFREFLKLAADRTSGTLQHPEFGEVRCKLLTADGEWDGRQMRDGVDVNVVWEEDLEEEDTFASALDRQSPADRLDAEAATADDAIDQAIAALKSKNAGIEAEALDQLKGFKDERLSPASFGDFARSLKAPLDQISATSARVAGSIDSIAYRANELSDSVAAVGSPALLWPIQEAADNLADSTARMKDTFASNGRTILLYTTAVETTLDDVARELGATFDDLLLLNPRLAVAPSVPANTGVRYYG